MALRGSVGRRSVKDPLTATLQDLNRRLRNLERITNQPGAGGATGATGDAGPAGATGAPGTTVQAEVLVTAANGKVTWSPAGGFPVVPVVSAVAAGVTPRAVTVESVSASTVVVQVWTLPAATAAGAGVSVHLSAVPPA